MVKLSEKTVQLLKDDIISILYDRPFLAMSTYKIAYELRRDNEFTLKLLLDLEKAGILNKIKRSPRNDKVYDRTTKWKLTQNYLKLISQNL